LAINNINGQLNKNGSYLSTLNSFVPYAACAKYPPAANFSEASVTASIAPNISLYSSSSAFNTPNGPIIQSRDINTSSSNSMITNNNRYNIGAEEHKTSFNDFNNIGSLAAAFALYGRMFQSTLHSPTHLPPLHHSTSLPMTTHTGLLNFDNSTLAAAAFLDLHQNINQSNNYSNSSSFIAAAASAAAIASVSASASVANEATSKKESLNSPINNHSSLSKNSNIFPYRSSMNSFYSDNTSYKSVKE
jgi:hypothetical protein